MNQHRINFNRTRTLLEYRSYWGLLLLGLQTFVFFSPGPHQPTLPVFRILFHPKDDLKSSHSLYAILRGKGQGKNCGLPCPQLTFHRFTLHRGPAKAKPLCLPSTRHSTGPKQATEATAFVVPTES